MFGASLLANTSETLRSRTRFRGHATMDPDQFDECPNSAVTHGVTDRQMDGYRLP